MGNGVFFALFPGQGFIRFGRPKNKFCDPVAKITPEVGLCGRGVFEGVVQYARNNRIFGRLIPYQVFHYGNWMHYVWNFCRFSELTTVGICRKTQRRKNFI